MEQLSNWWKNSRFVAQCRRKKSLADTLLAVQQEARMDKHLTLWSLTSLGIGSVVGAGIFVVTGQAAAKYAGPSLTLSFLIASVACMLTGLCYAELASLIPISGSAYSFAYISMGEAGAWLVALCLALEYSIAGAAVASGWSATVASFLGEFGVTIPQIVSQPPVMLHEQGYLSASGSLIDLPAVSIVLLITVVLSIGVKESARFNTAAVMVKISILLVFIAYGIKYSWTNYDVFSSNLTPYIPPNEGKFGKYGISGILRGSGAIFFAYIGFDSICAVVQECENAVRDVPRGIILTLVITTILYAFVTTFLTGMMNYKLLNVSDPVIRALIHVNAPLPLRLSVEIAAIAGLTSVCLVCLLSMPRLLLTMSNDGLVPAWLGEIHPRFRTPWYATIANGVSTALLAGMLPLDILGELVSFGTLVAFSVVCFSVIQLRIMHPEYKRPFTVPFSPYLPICGIITCILQIASLPLLTYLNYSIFIALGASVYVMYGRFHSRVVSKGTNLAEGGPPVELLPLQSCSSSVHVLRNVYQEEDPRDDVALQQELPCMT